MRAQYCVLTTHSTMQATSRLNRNFYKVFSMIEGSVANGKVRDQAAKKLAKEKKQARTGDSKVEKVTKAEIEKAVLKHHRGVKADVKCDITLILDTNFPHLLIQDFKRPTGITEAIVQPRPRDGPNGIPLGDESEWSQRLLKYLIRLGAKTNGRYAGWQEPSSLASIMSRVGKKHKHAPPIRLWTDEKAKGEKNNDKLIMQPMLDIQSFRKYGLFQFVGKVKQGTPPEVKKPTRMELRSVRTTPLAEIAEAAGVDLEDTEDEGYESNEDELFVGDGKKRKAPDQPGRDSLPTLAPSDNI